MYPNLVFPVSIFPLRSPSFFLCLMGTIQVVACPIRVPTVCALSGTHPFLAFDQTELWIQFEFLNPSSLAANPTL